MGRLGLTWVLVDGEPRPVAAFAHLAPRHRPPAMCPACGRRLTLKLGAVRRHHAAHASEVVCAATQPETALHLDVKLHLAAQLAAVAGDSASLVAGLQCGGGADAGCAAVREVPWLHGWDEVAIESRVTLDDAHRRPDIVLRRGGRPVGAIEVLATHRVSDEKAAALARFGVPWLEVEADEQLLGDGAGWSAASPLPVVRIGPHEAPDGWRCAEHARRDVLLRAARVVDVYREGGARERVIYRIDEVRVERATRALSLRRDGRELACVDWDGAPESRRAAWHDVREAYDADVRVLTAADGAFHDSPMRWATSDAADNLVHEALLDVRAGDSMPLTTRYPRRWFFARERGAWFLPPDMRDVTWDRSSPDAFAAHPAWAHSHAIVRERPVPIDSWSGFIFASRPVAASFATGASVVMDGSIAVVSLASGQPSRSRRALVIVSAPVDDAAVRRIALMLRDDGIEHLWLSHPLDWSAARGDLAWAAAGRDSRGRAVVVVDGLGIHHADAFSRAFVRGERRLRPESIRRRMAERVSALRRPEGRGN